MALCSCFKTQHQDDGNRRKGNNRTSIRSEKNELDLLEIQKRGMEPNDPDDQYLIDGDDDHRVSHQTDMQNSFQGNGRVSNQSAIKIHMSFAEPQYAYTI